MTFNHRPRHSDPGDDSDHFARALSDPRVGDREFALPQPHELKECLHLSPQEIDKLVYLESKGWLEWARILGEDPVAVALIMTSLERKPNNPAVLGFLLAALLEYIREDSSRIPSLLERSPAALGFLELLEGGADSNSSDMAAYIFAAMCCYAPPDSIPDYLIERFLDGVIGVPNRVAFAVSRSGILESLVQLLKRECYRDMIWSRLPFLHLISEYLTVGVQSQGSGLYSSCFSVWLLSTSADRRAQMIQHGFLNALCHVLKDCKSEKVVRITMRALSNFINEEAALEIMIDNSVNQV